MAKFITRFFKPVQYINVTPFCSHVDGHMSIQKSKFYFLTEHITAHGTTINGIISKFSVVNTSTRIDYLDTFTSMRVGRLGVFVAITNSPKPIQYMCVSISSSTIDCVITVLKLNP